MNKQEFLGELRNKLKGLPPEDVDNRVSFYEEMINDRMDEGKSEEEAIAEIGTVDEVVNEIAKDTPLTKLVKEKVKPKRSLRAWEIVLIVLGFPLWFPLLLTAFILMLVAYILLWVFVIVSYVTELALIVAAIGGIALFFIELFHGDFSMLYLGMSLTALGGSMLLSFGCYGATKLSVYLSKKMINGIKYSIIRKGRN